MGFLNLDIEALKLKGNHTQIYYAMRVEKILRIIKIIQIRNWRRQLMKQYQDV